MKNWKWYEHFCIKSHSVGDNCKHVLRHCQLCRKYENWKMSKLKHKPNKPKNQKIYFHFLLLQAPFNSSFGLTKPWKHVKVDLMSTETERGSSFCKFTMISTNMQNKMISCKLFNCLKLLCSRLPSGGLPVDQAGPIHHGEVHDPLAGCDRWLPLWGSGLWELHHPLFVPVHVPGAASLCHQPLQPPLAA